MPQFVRRRVSFDSHGSEIAGVLYLPAAEPGVWPCVVMAHGFSGTMDWIVPDFAEQFAEGGLAVLTFDYRNLGASEGIPRQLIDTRRQYEDLRQAVEFARSCLEVDGSRIALWGTSLGGSYVVRMAAEDPAITAVVANVPGIDLFAGIRGRHVPQHMRVGARRVIAATVRLLGAALLDAGRGFVGMSPHYIPVYGRLGQAVFADPQLAPLFDTVEQNAPSWRNQVAPRFLFTAPRYRRGTMERISAPLLVTVARDDEVISTAYVKEKAAKAPNHEIREYPVSHFDMYHGAVRDEVGADHLAFLRQHLAP